MWNWLSDNPTGQSLCTTGIVCGGLLAKGEKMNNVFAIITWSAILFICALIARLFSHPVHIEARVYLELPSRTSRQALFNRRLSERLIELWPQRKPLYRQRGHMARANRIDLANGGMVWSNLNTTYRGNVLVTVEAAK